MISIVYTTVDNEKLDMFKDGVDIYPFNLNRDVTDDVFTAVYLAIKKATATRTDGFKKVGNVAKDDDGNITVSVIDIDSKGRVNPPKY